MIEFGELAFGCKRGKIILPDAKALRLSVKIGSQLPKHWATAVTISCAHAERDTFYQELNQWFDEVSCDQARYMLFGAFKYAIHQFRVDCDFIGVTVYFVDYTDAVHIKLAMADRCFKKRAA